MIKPFLLSTSVFALLGATPAAADGVLSLGLTFALGGGGTAASVGLWSNNESGEGAVGVTGNYYFNTGQWGAAANVGYVEGNAIGSVGYDFLQQVPVIGLHAIDGDNDDGAPMMDNPQLPPDLPPGPESPD